MIRIKQRQVPKKGETAIIYIGEYEYCIINQNERIYAIDNLCPHKHASLGLGEIKSDEIICPLHQYRFNFKTGKCNIEGNDVGCYEVVVE